MRAAALVALVALAACGAVTPTTSVEIPLPQIAAHGNGVYAIRLERPTHIGAQSHWLVTAEEDRITTTTRGKEIVSDDHTKKRARLDAIATVTSLDAHSEADNVAFDVKTLTYAVDGRELVHHTRGHIDTQRAKKEADAKITVDGADANDDMRAAMKLLFTLTNGAPSDDEVIGTSALQHIGSHWPVDAKRAAEVLAQEDAQMLQGASVSGDSWLESVGLFSGVECLDVHSVFHIDNLDFGTKMPGSTADVARVTATYSGKYPIDTTRARVADRFVSEVTVKLRTPSPAGEIVVEIELASHRDGSYLPVTP